LDSPIAGLAPPGADQLGFGVQEKKVAFSWSHNALGRACKSNQLLIGGACRIS
jgi:hypothetical protein